MRGGAIQALRQTVLSPRHSRPIAGSFKKTDAPVGLTSSIKDVERDLKAQGQAVSYNYIRRLLGSRQSTPVPELRAFAKQTDKCDKCFDMKAALADLKNLAGKGGSDFLDASIKLWSSSLQAELTRDERQKIDAFVLEVAARRARDPDGIKAKWELLHAVCQHKYFAEQVYASFKRERTSITATNFKIVRIFDWKASMRRGEAPVEASTRIYEYEQTSCHGCAMYYWHASLQKIAVLFVATLSDVMNHTAQAEIATEKAIREEVLSNPEYAAFAEAYRLCRHQVDHYDCGPHYQAYEFMGYKLLVEPVELQKTVCVQFFEFKHGKSSALDQDLFSGVIGQYLIKMPKKGEVLYTSDFVNWFRQQNAEQRADTKLYSAERLELRKHHFWQWTPTEEPPKMVARLNATSLKLNRYWQSTPLQGTGVGGKTQVDIEIAPISPMHSRFRLQRLQLGFGFTHSDVKCTEVWEYAREVRPPAITNSSSILRQSAAMQKTLEAKTPGDMEHYNLAQAKALKRKQASDRASTREEKKGKTGDSCRAVQRFTEDSLKSAQQKELQDECSAHGLSITPPNKDLRARLRAHYNALQHSHKPAGASSDQATTYYSESLSAVNPELVERAAARTINTIASLFAKQAAKEV